MVRVVDSRVIRPSRWRKQHGRIEAVYEQVQDADGNIGAPYRGLTLLDQWNRAGRISKEMHLAGDKFHELFQLACLDPLYAADMSRIGGATAPVRHRGSLVAREAVHAALEALGGTSGHSGSCAWYVLGCDCSIRVWAMRVGWQFRAIDQKVAAGILIGSLGTLAKHFGY